MKNIFYTKKDRGFAMLFTVLVVSIILTISLGISNITFKQGILSNLAKDSQISFYKADAAVECGMYADLTLNLFPDPTDPATLSTILCGDSTFNIDQAKSHTNYFFFSDQVDSPVPCATFTVDKESLPGQTIVQARGYNVCNVNPRKVERALQATY